jgi:signal transduction histidine kinase
LSEVLRLTRVSLLLRLIPVFIAGGFMIASGQANVLLLVMLVLQPSLILLVFATIMQHRNMTQPRQVRFVVKLTIVVYIAEMVVPPLLLQLLSGQRIPILPFDISGDTVISNDLASSSAIPLFFSLIPAVLGAWMDGRAGALRWAFAVIGLNLLSVLALSQLFGVQTVNLFGFTAVSLVTGVVCYFVGSLADQQRAEHAQLEAANRQLAEQAIVREQLATTRERMRLSRDLHDTVAHKLAALSLQINAIDSVMRTSSPPAPQSMQDEIATAKMLVKESLNDTREAIGGLRASPVDDIGLAGALQRLVDGVANRSGVAVSFEAHGAEQALPADAANAMYEITQEALNNVERHSQAARAWVTLEYDPAGHTATLCVRDDGIGFDTSSILDDARFGLTSMRERAALAGARLRVDSIEGAGTTVSVGFKD